jgi:Ca-activated chloride channel family protein
MKIVRQLIILLLIAFSLMTVWTWYQERKQGGSKPPAGAPPQTAKPAVEPQMETTGPPIRPSWPPPAADGSESPVAEDVLAKNYYIILDSSGSMAESKCAGGKSKSEAAKRALALFSKAVPPDANLGLAVFDADGIAERLPLGKANRDDFASMVKATAPGDGTPLHDAVALGYRKLTEGARRQLGYGEYHIVIVTDGEANKGQDPTPVVNDILINSPILIHTIGFCIGTNHSLNQQGRTIYRAADNPEQLMKGLEEVLAESPGFDLTDFR